MTVLQPSVFLALSNIINHSLVLCSSLVQSLLIRSRIHFTQAGYRHSLLLHIIRLYHISFLQTLKTTMVATFFAFILAAVTLASALPTIDRRTVQQLDQAAFAEAHPRDNGATRAFSSVQIKVR